MRSSPASAADCASPTYGQDMRVPSPAKLNLFLHITGRREDGYHQLQTIFQFIDLCDELDFEVDDQPGCCLVGDDCGVANEKNLIVRAALSLAAHCQISQGVRISLTKRIPIGGGLGGGSSNAATTLLVLNRLWDCGLSPAELAELGLELGADVPVFVYGHASWAEGIGERLKKIELVEPWYLVIYPGVAVNTAAIFAAPELTRNTPRIKISAFLRQGGKNDCEPVVRRLVPEVDAAVTWLNSYASAQLTGTGSCVFASFSDRQAAQSAARAIPGRWIAYVTRGMNRSATHLALYD